MQQKRKVKKEFKAGKESVSFIFSVLLHSLVAVVLLFSSVTKQDSPEETFIDVVTLHDFNPDFKDTAALVPQQKRKNRVEDRTENREETLVEKSSAKGDTLQANLKPDVAIGESDIESSLRGRAPSNETERYLAEIRDQIARQQAYPAPSRAFREEGTVKIRLTLNRSGSVVKIELMEASLYKRLNDAAMKAATRAAPFRSFPEEVSFETWKVTLPVRFTFAEN